MVNTQDNKKSILKRIYIIHIMLVLFGIAIIAKAIHIQFVEGDELKEKANKNVRYSIIEAKRGDIYSRDGSLLATSIPIYEARMDLKAKGLTDKIFYEELDSLCIYLEKYVGEYNREGYKKLLIEARKKGIRSLLIKKNMRYPEMKLLKTFPLFRKGRYKSGLVITVDNSRRELPYKDLASRTIGYIKGDFKVGLEAAYNKELSGTNGKILEQRISGDLWKPISDKIEMEPRDGNDIHSTIDINIQDVAESELKNQLIKHNAHHGCVVVMEVQTGNIIAIANLTRNKDGNYYEMYNYAIGEATEPGSTFKTVSLMCALEDGVVDLDDTINIGNGTIKYFDREMKDVHASQSRLSLLQAFAQSSNVAISKIIFNNYIKKPSKFTDRIYSIGLHEKLGIEIEGEGQPIIKNPKNKTWAGTTLPWMSIGYEVKLTPLQLLTFYNAIANNGKMVKPRFVTKITKNGKTIKEMPIVVLRERICSEQTVKKLRKLLESVVNHPKGTARNLKNLYVPIAGKTGTAQIAKKSSGYKTENGVTYQASFVGYFPADNPKYSCIVVVHAPSNNVFYGNVVAGPIFKEIVAKIYSNRISLEEGKIKPDSIKNPPKIKITQKNELVEIMKKLQFNFKCENTTTTKEWCQAIYENNHFKIKDVNILTNKMPDLKGMNLKDAIYILESKGLKVKFSGVGTIVSQSIPPGTPITKGQEIELKLLQL